MLPITNVPAGIRTISLDPEGVGAAAVIFGVRVAVVVIAGAGIVGVVVAVAAGGGVDVALGADVTVAIAVGVWVGVWVNVGVAVNRRRLRKWSSNDQRIACAGQGKHHNDFSIRKLKSRLVISLPPAVVLPWAV